MNRQCELCNRPFYSLIPWRSCGKCSTGLDGLTLLFIGAMLGLAAGLAVSFAVGGLIAKLP